MALLERVQFQRRGSGADGAGNTATGWANLGPVLHATIADTGGGEAVIAAKLQGRQVCTVEVRVSPLLRTINTTDRIFDITNQRALKIRQLPAIPRAGFVKIICEAGVATG